MTYNKLTNFSYLMTESNSEFEEKKILTFRKYYILFNQNKNNTFEEIYKMLMDSLDKSQTDPQHQTKKLKNVVKSKCFKISIGLCIVFTLVVTVGLIIKPTQKPPKKPKHRKYKYLIFNNCTWDFYLSKFVLSANIQYNMYWSTSTNYQCNDELVSSSSYFQFQENIHFVVCHENLSKKFFDKITKS